MAAATHIDDYSGWVSSGGKNRPRLRAGEGTRGDEILVRGVEPVEERVHVKRALFLRGQRDHPATHTSVLSAHSKTYRNVPQPGAGLLFARVEVARELVGDAVVEQRRGEERQDDGAQLDNARRHSAEGASVPCNEARSNAQVSVC